MAPFVNKGPVVEWFEFDINSMIEARVKVTIEIGQDISNSVLAPPLISLRRSQMIEETKTNENLQLKQLSEKVKEQDELL